ADGAALAGVGMSHSHVRNLKEKIHMNTRNVCRGVVSLILLPMILSAQGQRDVIQLKNWAAPLYWQSSSGMAAAKLSSPANELVNQVEAANPSNLLVFGGMTPCRVVDTRTGWGFAGPFGAPSLVGGSSRTFPIQLSPPPCFIPS